MDSSPPSVIKIELIFTQNSKDNLWNYRVNSLHQTQIYVSLQYGDQLQCVH